MAKPREEQEAVNADSFLDIVASVVSIMLIMVMMIGMRIRNTSVDGLVAAGVEQAAETLRGELANEQTLREDIVQTAEQIAGVQRSAAIKATERDMLGVTVAAMEDQLRQQRAKLSATDQARFDMTRQLTVARQQLEQLQGQREAIERSEAPPVVLQNLPTPISRNVDGFEVHFQLRAGRIALVPLRALIHAAEQDARTQQLGPRGELVRTVGPIGNFRMEYTVSIRERGPNAGQAGGPIEARGEIIPNSEHLGEKADEAMAPRSAFRGELAGNPPGRYTVTLWVYPDSFELFRRVREELHRQGYAVAARPLNMEDPIGFSTDGTKSSAQ